MNIVSRFMAKVEKHDADCPCCGGCWLWTAARFENGYGTFWVDGRNVRAHRFAYELLVGPIPEGLDVDHVRERGCRHRHCVNPAHLEPVTRVENLLRGVRNQHRFATRCTHNHLLSPENTRVEASGYRRCLTCDRARLRRRRALLSAHKEKASSNASR